VERVEKVCGSKGQALADIAAKRAIVDEYVKEQWVLAQGHRTGWTEGGQAVRETALKLLSSVYSEHPDYRSEWAV
jgi:hypothetical protein